MVWWWYRVIIVSALSLSLSLRDKDRLRDRESLTTTNNKLVRLLSRFDIFRFDNCNFIYVYILFKHWYIVNVQYTFSVVKKSVKVYIQHSLRWRGVTIVWLLIGWWNVTWPNSGFLLVENLWRHLLTCCVTQIKGCTFL